MDQSAREPSRVLVVDDHPAYRAVMREVVQATPGLELAGEGTSGEEAIEAVKRLAAGVVIMDKRMPGIGGLAACRAITQRDPGVAVILCSVEDHDHDAVNAYGAAAVIRKQDLSPATLQAVLASRS
jgi:DNA-binding NarL/FixJ family response regulator